LTSWVLNPALHRYGYWCVIVLSEITAIWYSKKFWRLSNIIQYPCKKALLPSIHFIFLSIDPLRLSWSSRTRRVLCGRMYRLGSWWQIIYKLFDFRKLVFVTYDPLPGIYAPIGFLQIIPTGTIHSNVLVLYCSISGLTAAYEIGWDNNLLSSR